MMKKFILFGFAFLSAIGAQAADTTYPESITYNNVNYALTHTEEDDVIQESSPKITTAIVSTENTTSTGTISLNTTASATRTCIYSFNAKAMSVNGGENVVYNLELNDFVATETLPISTNLNSGSYTLGSPGYNATMKLAADSNALICHFDSIKNINKYYWIVKSWDDEEDEYVYNKYSSSDTTVLKSAFPQYRQAYYYVNLSKGNCYLIQSVTVNETTSRTTTNQYNCVVSAIDSNFRVTSTITNVTLGSKIRNIPNSSIFSEATNLALITVSGTTSDYKFRDGILYKIGYGSTATYEKEIVTATTSLKDQTLAETIDSIYTNAFANAPEGVVLTSTNYDLNLHLNDNDKFKVIFLIPDEHATITEGPNGGYIVKGNLTQNHITSLQIKGTYMDFYYANLLTDIHFNNEEDNSNTLLYFNSNPGKEVTGYKNIIIGEYCDNCIITDNGSDRFYCPYAFTANSLTYTRKFDCMWKTVALPFTLTDNHTEDLLIVGKLDNYDVNTNTYNFLYSTSISAYQPYIVKTKDERRTIDYILQDIRVETTKITPKNYEGNVSFVPVFERDTLYSSQNATHNYYGIQNIYNENTRDYSNFMQIFEGVKINPFRAYLVGPKVTAGAANYRLVDAMGQLIEEGELPITTSSIEKVEETETSEAIFNLNGQKVNNAHRGLNIVNGKVILNK